MVAGDQYGGYLSKGLQSGTDRWLRLGSCGNLSCTCSVEGVTAVETNVGRMEVCSPHPAIEATPDIQAAEYSVFRIQTGLSRLQDIGMKEPWWTYLASSVLTYTG